MPKSVEKSPSKIIKATVKFTGGQAITGWFYPEVDEILKRAGMKEQDGSGAVWCG